MRRRRRASNSIQKTSLRYRHHEIGAFLFVQATYGEVRPRTARKIELPAAPLGLIGLRPPNATADDLAYLTDKAFKRMLPVFCCVPSEVKKISGCGEIPRCRCSITLRFKAVQAV